MDFAWYITGFTDGEGCFSVSFNPRSKLRTRVEVRPSFCIAQNMRSLQTLEQIKDYFGCGSIRFSRSDNSFKYEVRSLNDLIERVIPHFQKYPLLTTKAQDFRIFAEICQALVEKKHLEPTEMSRLVDLAFQMNNSGTRRYTKQMILSILTR